MSDRPEEGLFDELADGILIYDVETGEIRAVNESGLEMLGYESEELVGRSIDAIRADALGDPIDTVQQELPLRQEWRLERHTGETIPVDVTIVCTDRGGEKRALVSIRETPNRIDNRIGDQYRLLAENYPNGAVTIVNRDLEYQLVAGELFETMELSPEELEGRPVGDVLPENIANRLLAGYEDALDGTSREFEIDIDGCGCRVHVRPIEEHGTIVGAIGVVREVTVEQTQRRAIETARRKYLTLVDASPDPMVVVDTETREIIETNQAATELFGLPQPELVGRQYLDLYPDADADQYRQRFEQCTDEACVCRTLPDGRQMYALDRDGTEHPIEWSTATVDLDGRPVVYIILREISDRLRYEQALEALSHTGEELLHAETNHEIAEIVVETVDDVIDLSAVAVYLFDENERLLRPIAYSEHVERFVGTPPTFGPESSVAWRVFEEGSTAVFDDVRAAAEVYNPETPLRSEMIVPLGDRGVLLVGSTEQGVFDDHTVNLVELMASKTMAALDRVEREQSLRGQERELQGRNEQLEELARLNAEIRTLSQSLVVADTRKEIEAVVCEQLRSNDWIEFVWIGERDPIDERLVRREAAGDDYGYLDRIDRTLESGDDPSVSAARSGEPTVIENTARNLQDEPWRRQAIRRDVKSVMAIPLRYDDCVYGVLTVYANRSQPFQGAIRSVLSELGEIVGYAINAVQRKEAILTNQATELEFRITDLSCFVLRVARQTDTHLDVKGMVPQEDGTIHLFVAVRGGSVDRLLTHASDAADVDRVRLVSDRDESPIVQLQVSGSFVGAELADHGIRLKRISADEDGARIVVDVPPTMNVHAAVETIVSLYSGSELLAQREHDRPIETTTALPGTLLDRLTTRQREAVELAYRSGYFHSPKESTGDELAAEMGLSSSAFHRHLRSAERTIFSSLFDRSDDDYERSDDDYERSDAD